MNELTTTYEWKTLPWRKLERRVFKLQKRIYRASLRGDVSAVRRLQRLMMKSWAAKCLAVRRVTQDNQGKKTAGIDGLASLSPKARLTLVGRLQLGDKATASRRVWIPKPGSSEPRPLSIPVIYDRAVQALVNVSSTSCVEHEKLSGKGKRGRVKGTRKQPFPFPLSPLTDPKLTS